MTSTLDTHDCARDRRRGCSTPTATSIEPPRVWDELLPAKFRDYAPRVLQHDG